jgi:hypothetical protein
MIDGIGLEKIRAGIRRFPRGISDGPVCLERYSKATRRIVWVLREVNHQGDDQWDLADFLCNHLFDYPRWHCTFGLVAKMSRALLQHPMPEVLPCASAREAADSIRDVAVVNIKKTGGSGRTCWPSLVEDARAFRPLVDRQLAAMDPDIVIAAGTFELMPGLGGSSRWRVIRTYHPGQTRLTHEAVYAGILGDLAAMNYPSDEPAAAIVGITEKEEFQMPAVALSGAVVVENNGAMIRWKKKCEKCGWVDGSTTSQTSPSRNATTSTSFSCPKCKNHQSVKLQGS